MAKVKITIDGKQITADSNMTILDAARSMGIEIPTLCHDPRLEPFTSCFVCVVEVEGARGYVPSCSTRLTDKMIIRTGTPEIMQARKAALELLVSNHFADCLGPCKLTCPAGVDVQGYIAMLSLGRYREAVALIKETNPFPSVCGRVCTRPCEGQCRRNITGEPVGVDYLKRYAADLDRECGHPFTPEKKASTGRRIAVIGGGPAGLSAAYYLALEGHHVKVFEANVQCGGWLRYGIPEYRLPEDVLDYEIDSILKLGVEVQLNARLGRDFTLESLFDDGWESVFLGLGAQGSTRMNIAGEDAAGVMAGIEFLEKANKGEIGSIQGNVVVVGGGNTAVDAARTSLRLGAAKVTLVYRRSRQEMPAHHLEIEEMEHEGTVLELLANPVEFHRDGTGRVTGLTCVRMALGEPDASGRRRPVPVPGSEFRIPADWVFQAIGQQPETDYLTSSVLKEELKTTRWGTLEVDPETMATSVPGIFAGGDMVTGAATAIEAIAAGKRAASAIHYFLSGRIIPGLAKVFLSKKDNLKKELAAGDLPVRSAAKRQIIPALPLEERLKGFVEVELGYSPEQARAEVDRCLECGCTSFFECDLQRHCSDYAVEQGGYGGDFRNEPPDESHPFLRLEMNKCILCGRCVRICEEVTGASALGFVNRGFDAHIRPALVKPLLETTCVSCGQCADTCPTGAITVKPDTPKPGPFKLEGVPSVCNYCGVGCGIKLEALGDRIVRVCSEAASPVTDGGNLCKSGRFGFRALNGSDRLARPWLRRNGKLQEATLEETLGFIAGRIKQLQNQAGGESLAVVAGPRLTNEEAYLLQKIARGVFGTPNVYDGRYPAVDAGLANLPSSAYGQSGKAELVLAIGINTAKNYPVLDFKLQKLARGGKPEIYYFHPEETALARQAQHWLPLPAAGAPELCRGLLASFLQQMEPAPELAGIENLKQDLAGTQPADAFRRIGLPVDRMSRLCGGLASRRTLVVFDPVELGAAGTACLYNLAVLMESRGRTLSLLPLFQRVNSRGLLETGLHPGLLPGGKPVDDPAARQRWESVSGLRLPAGRGRNGETLLDAIGKGEIRGLILFGHGLAGLDQLASRLDLLVVADLYSGPAAEYAHAVLPLASFAESEGTVLNSERRLQRLHSALPPRSGKSNLQLLQGLAEACGAAPAEESIDRLWKEMKLIIPSWPGTGPGEIGVEGVLLPGRLENASLIRIPAPTAPVPAPGIDIQVQHWQDIQKAAGLC